MSKEFIIETIIKENSGYYYKESRYNNGNIVMVDFDIELLDKIDNYRELDHFAIYFLLNKNISIYIGQTNNLKNRIFNHYKEKSFDRVIAFFSDNNLFSRTFVDYLEWLYIKRFSENKLFKMVNSSSRSNEPNISLSERIKIDSAIKSIDSLFLSINIRFNHSKTKYKYNSIETKNFIFKENVKRVSTSKKKKQCINYLSSHKKYLSKDKILNVMYDFLVNGEGCTKTEKKYFLVEKKGWLSWSLIIFFNYETKRDKGSIRHAEFSNIRPNLEKEIDNLLRII